MIDIEPKAENYFAKLIAQENEPGLSVQLGVKSAGTNEAKCDLSFCDAKQMLPDDVKLNYEGFDLYIQSKAVEYLKGAQITLTGTGMAEELKIVAPNIYGNNASEVVKDENLYDGISRTLQEEINPMLASHGGFCQLYDLLEDNTVVLQFGGGCQGCSMVDMTLKQGVEVRLKEKFPEIKKVIDSTDHKAGRNPYMT